MTGKVKRNLSFEKIDFHFFVDSDRKKYALFNEKNCLFRTALFILQMHFREEHSNLIVYYVPRRIMRVIMRRATMLAQLAGDRTSNWSKPRRHRGAISPAIILSESRNSLVITRIVCIGAYSIFADVVFAERNLPVYNNYWQFVSFLFL